MCKLALNGGKSNKEVCWTRSSTSTVFAGFLLVFMLDANEFCGERIQKVQHLRENEEGLRWSVIVTCYDRWSRDTTQLFFKGSAFEGQHYQNVYVLCLMFLKVLLYLLRCDYLLVPQLITKGSEGFILANLNNYLFILWICRKYSSRSRVQKAPCWVYQVFRGLHYSFWKLDSMFKSIWLTFLWLVTCI